MSSSSPHHRVSAHQQQHFHNNSPTTTLSEDDSNSEPNDLRTSQKIRHHSSATFPGYPFFSPPQHNSASMQSQQHSQQSGQQYVATNECRLIEYRGARIAAFLSANRSQCPEYLLCLPQAFELFLKHLVGGLHTVYTKLKRLDIVPIVCNVEQVRILRGLGAIQPGVNRCKLLSTLDFDVLFKDCTTARPGRPPKRSTVTGIVSPVPSSFTSGPQQHNVVPFLGYPTAKKARFSDDTDYASENPDLKQSQHSLNNNTSGNNTAATAAAMLAANGYSAAFPFLQHFSAGNTPTPQQQQQLVAAAAALGLPGLPPRFSNASPPPGITASHQGNNGNNATSDSSGVGSDFNPTAAYLWLLSQQQQQQQHIPNSAALNLSSRNTNINSTANTNLNNSNSINTNNNNTNNNPNNTNNSNNTNTNNINNNNNSISGTVNNNNRNVNADDDDSTDDDDDEDDVESNASSNNSANPVSSSGFNGISCGTRGASETASNRNSSTTPPHPQQQQTQQPEHCLETLLRNIEGLLAIAAHNARQQQTQLHLQKAELRAELSAQLEREREMKEHLEKQLNEEQKIRILYQKRFKKERRFRRKLEHELHQQHQQQLQNQQQQLSLTKQQITQNQQQNQVSLKSSPTPPPQQQTEPLD